jgi:hypothetical protein
MLDVNDIRELMESCTLITKKKRREFLKGLKEELLEKSSLEKQTILRHVYNIIEIVKNVKGGDGLFKNGRIIFDGDRGKLYDSLVGLVAANEAVLFTGCVVKKESNNTLIELKDVFVEPRDIYGNFDFKKLVERAVSIPDEKIVINADILPYRVEDLLKVLK